MSNRQRQTCASCAHNGCCADTANNHPTGTAAMTREHIFVRCEQCRNHGRCKKERTAFRIYHVKGCFVKVKREDAL